MSTPDSLYVYRNGDDFEEVTLGKRAAGDLFNYLLPRLDTAAPDFKDEFDGQYSGDVFALDALPGQYFPAIYQLIMTACDELDSLKPHKAALQATLQADPRYRRAV